ncbi:PEP-CTERM sorting domain-containing protein [Methylophilus sp. 14]|uniref:PEP-CTERM sorting domain-containing protein n=1 Tax=Methylophilus sp. 14 TaxID=2781019 RepID=UPI00188FF1FB|nr:PEP-CTERM sorting domain-containing protein [Methylophilus sp. 14]MBF4988179.1 PEP-CTERM sorting domain-containing protein [Methylophilus sp. 14]
MSILKKSVVVGLMALVTTPAMATVSTYNVTTTWFEPDTQPKNTYFVGSFTYDSATKTITGLAGQLSEAMTGSTNYNPGTGVNGADDMTWLSLNHQLVSWYDASLGGTFAATFKNTSTNTFWTGLGGNGWSPASGVAAGGIYYGFPSAKGNPGNAYALIFVPDNPLTALTQTQINKLAYADCAAGGMMGATCMTGTSVSGYGAVGTMSGYPLAQTISAVTVPVPEPESYAMFMVGVGLLGLAIRQKRQIG